MASVRERGIAGNTRSAGDTKKPVVPPAIGGGTSDIHSVVNSTTEKSPGPSVENPAIGEGTKAVHRIATGAKGNSAGPSQPERQTENPGKIPNNSSDEERDKPFDTDYGQAVEPPQAKGRGDPKQKKQPQARYENKGSPEELAKTQPPPTTTRILAEKRSHQLRWISIRFTSTTILFTIWFIELRWSSSWTSRGHPINA